MSDSRTTIEEQPVLKLRVQENPCWNEKYDEIVAHANRVESQQYKDGDWRKKLFEDGYVVIKGAIPKEQAQKHGDGIRDILTSFGTKLDYNDKSTWKEENYPDQSHINTYMLHCIPHEKAVWDVRNDKNIKDVFAKLWGTDELLVSFDAINVTFPGSTKAGFWPHADQSPYREGLQCVQGLVSLSDAGPKDGGLVVYKKSNTLFEKFFEEKVDKNDTEKWRKLDYFSLNDEELKWFLDNGCEEVKIDCENGDLVLWDSRTIHFGREPDADSQTVRTVVYACYTPAAWATEKELKDKQEAFWNYRNTTHWPHVNIWSDYAPLKPSGRVEVRKEPLNKCDTTDEGLLKIAGVKSY